MPVLAGNVHGPGVESSFLWMNLTRSSYHHIGYA